MKKLIEKTSLGITALLLGSPAFAAIPDVHEAPYSSQTVKSIASKIVTQVLGFAGAVAVLFIIYAGILYITSSGNKDRIETAKKTLTYAVLGVVIVVLSEFIVAFISGNIPKFL